MVWRANPVNFATAIDPSVLKDRSVLITGGADGLGYGAAKAMAEAGAYVTIADYNETLGQERQAEFSDTEQHVLFVWTDVTSWESLTAAFKAAIEHSPSGSLDLVIANAGLGGTSILDAAFPKDLPQGEDLPAPARGVLDVNLIGVYYTTVLALHYFKKTHHSSSTYKKHLIMTCSLAGYIEQPLDATYNAAKFGVRGMWKAIRYHEEALGFPFRANIVAPCFVATAMTAGDLENIARAGVEIAQVEAVSAAFMRLACDEDINGRAICNAGDSTFDLGDDPAGQDGFQAWWQALVNEDTFGPGAKGVIRYDEFVR